jgi:hypothetical protein
MAEDRNWQEERDLEVGTVDYLKVATCPAFFMKTLWTAITNIMIGSTE